jgi:MFS family permease
MFRSAIFSLTLVVIGTAIVVQYAILVFLPLELEGLRGMTALRVGVLLTPMAIAAAITFPLGGRLTDAIGPRYPVVAGAALLGGSAWMLAHLDLSSPTSTIVIAIVIQGLGYGLALMPNSVTGLNALPRRFIAQATAVRQLNQRVAASFGVAVLATVLATQSKGFAPTSTRDVGASTVQDAYNTLFTVVMVLAAIATVLALFLPGRRRNQELLAERTAEQAEADAVVEAGFDVG